jgi:ribonucleoside-diphosphate reductase alpha chain
VGHRTLDGTPHVLPAKLKGLGFTASDIDAIWGSLETGFNLDTVFSPFALSDETKNGIGLPGDVSDGRGVLRHVGFTDAEIAEANDWIFGNDTIEGAPYLGAEHLAVFDTANRCGVKGTRFLSWRAHIDMMAVCQPFLSGAISKTVNMPADASVDDVREAYRYSWQSGVKAVALYRDGSKLSQPLMSIAGIEVTGDYTVEEKTRIVTQMARELGLRFAGERRRLADSRDGNTQKAVLDGHKMYIRTGEYEDGTLGEIFIDLHKEGSPFRGLMNNFAVAISIGLQFGVPLEEYVEAFANTRFEPAGLVHHHSNLRQASSLLDLVFRHLAFRYLGREDMVHVPTPTSKTDLAPREERFAVSDRAGVGETGSAAASATVAIERATSGENFTGNSCSNCGSLKMIRSGTCETCSDCGTTTGC